MKKIIFFLLLLMTLLLNNAFGESGIGSVLEIKDTFAPSIKLLGTNNTGSMDGNFLFSYNATDNNLISKCHLIFNNKVNTTKENITKNNRSEFELKNLRPGKYNYSFKCFDNLDNNRESAFFTMTINLMTKFGGSTTNITNIDNTKIPNFSLEVSDYGKIFFPNNIDLSNGYDLDSFINFTRNKIQLDSSQLSVLNTSATLRIYNLTFNDPRILIDGNVCPSTICTKVNYSGGTLIFNVTHFTEYSSEESPSGSSSTSTTQSSGGGGGGGAGGGGGSERSPVIKKTEFSLDKENIKVVLRQGEEKKETLSIKNIGETSIQISTDLKNFKDFVIQEESDVSNILLNPNEEKNIKLSFSANENQKPDIYTGAILVKSGKFEKLINTIIEVESSKPLFDVDVEVLPQYKIVSPGERIFIEVSLFNVRGFGRVDVNLEYNIKDFENNIIATEKETIAVETKAKFTRELLVPSSLKQGSYVASVKVTFGDSVGISSDVFEVKAKTVRLYPISIKDLRVYIVFGFVAVLFVIALVVFHELHSRKLNKVIPKEAKGKILQSEQKTMKLRLELEALERAYNSKFISEESYLKAKGRIQKELAKLKD